MNQSVSIETISSASISSASIGGISCKSRYFIVALDGGGVRCALQITLLKRILNKFPWLEEKICLVAGTSAGALVGCALSTLGLQKMLDHMGTQAFAKKIFSESWVHEVRSMKGLYRANYINAELAKHLTSVFGTDTTLDHFKKTQKKSDLLVTSFRIDTSTKEIFCQKCVATPTPSTEKQELNREAIPQEETETRWSKITNLVRWKSNPPTQSISQEHKEKLDIIQETCNEKKKHQATTHVCNCVPWHAQIYHTFESCTEKIVDVLLQTTAAPTYFPAHQGCVDGAVIAQNPSLLATTFALKYGEINGMKIDLKDIVVLSLGSGSHPLNMNYYGCNADLGLAQWAPNLMYLFNDASLDLTDINCINLLGQNYIRVQIKMPRDVDLANYDVWSELVQWAEKEDLSRVFEKLASLE